MSLPTVVSATAPSGTTVNATNTVFTFVVPVGVTTSQVLALAWGAQVADGTTTPGAHLTGGGPTARGQSGNGFVSIISQGLFAGLTTRPVVAGDNSATITLTIDNGGDVAAVGVAACAQLLVISNWAEAYDVGTHGDSNTMSMTTTVANELLVELFMTYLNSGVAPTVSNSNGAGTTLVGAVQAGNDTSTGKIAMGVWTRPATTVGTYGPDANTAPTGNGPYWVALGLTLPIQAAPTLQDPASSSSADLSGTPTFDWTYNQAFGTGTQAAWAMRRKTSGAYSYWNDTTHAWVGAIVWNTSAVSSVTFPAAAWSNGNTYSWSVATQDTTLGAQSAFAPDFIVIAQAPPTVAVTAPTGVIGVSYPTVAWTTTPAGGASQIAYRVIFYSAAQYGAGGFTPGLSAGYADSGVLPGNAASYTVPSGTVLPNNTVYRAYVQVWETGNEPSAWAFSAFTLTVDTPAPPIITATPGVDGTTGAPIVTIAVQGTDNLLSADDASFEGSIGTFVGANCALAKSSTVTPVDGTFQLRLTASSAATMSASTGFYTGVLPLTQYSVTAAFRTAVTARSCTVAVQWYDSSNTLLRTDTSGASNDSAVYGTRTLTATSPASTAKFKIVVTVTSPANAEVHYVDVVGLRPGPDPTWYRGGIVGVGLALVQSSDDGGATWMTVRNGAALALPAANQLASLVDYEAIPSTARTYQAMTAAVLAGATVLSPASNTPTATITTTDWWFIVPTLPALSCVAFVSTQSVPISERASVHTGLGSKFQTVVADVVGGLDGALTAETTTTAAWLAILAVIRAQRVVWLTAPGGVVAQYARLGVTAGSSGNNTAISATLAQGTPVYRKLALDYIEQPRP